MVLALVHLVILEKHVSFQSPRQHFSHSGSLWKATHRSFLCPALLFCAFHIVSLSNPLALKSPPLLETPKLCPRSPHSYPHMLLGKPSSPIMQLDGLPSPLNGCRTRRLRHVGSAYDHMVQSHLSYVWQGLCSVII